MALDTFYRNKIEGMNLQILEGQAKLRRLEAQRNDYNSRVRLLREELGLLQQPGSYVGEVVKVMSTKKVLVKVHPEGKYGKLEKDTVATSHRADTDTICSCRYLGRRRHLQTWCWQACHPSLRLIQTREDASVIGRPSCVSHDGGESAGFDI